jgi:GntR family transcriptional regulator, transcriptional repressor for pyruvate dehydrogenase complex
MEAIVKIEKVTKNTVVRQVMDQIKTQIATGQLVPGDKIPTEPQLAEQFGTGRSTIREAIKIFEYLGIIESHTRTGTYICDYTNISTEALTWAILLGKNEIFELVDLRRVIEQRAIEIIIGKAENDQAFLESILESLETEIKSMENAVQNQNLEELIDADYNIHGIIIEASNNNVYSNIYQTLKAFMHEEIKKTHKNDPPLSSSVDSHREIIEAIRKKDHAAAVKAFKNHIDSTIEQLR